MGDDEDDGPPEGCDPEHCFCSTCESKTEEGCPHMEPGQMCPGVGFTCAGFNSCPFIDDKEE